MLTLFHHPMSTGSRYTRLILNEYDIEVELIEENSWARRKEFLALNPAGTLPVLLAEGDVPVSGASVIAEYIDETRGALKRSRRLFPEHDRRTGWRSAGFRRYPCGPDKYHPAYEIYRLADGNAQLAGRTGAELCRHVSRRFDLDSRLSWRNQMGRI
jgi:glutathione S-transferase